MSITQAQTLAKTYSGSGLNGTATFGAGVTNGNLLVARVMLAAGTQTYTTPAGWASAVQANGGSQVTTAIFYTIVGSGIIGGGNSFGGTTAFAFSWAASHSFGIEIEEWNSSTGWLASPLDVTAAINGSVTSTALDSGTTATTAQAVELWIGSWAYKSAVQTITGITAGWANNDNTANGATAGQVSLSQVVSATGAARVQGTLTTTAISNGAVATFIPSPAGIVSGSVSVIGSTALVETAAQILGPSPIISNSTLVQTSALVLGSTALLSTSALVETAAQTVTPSVPLVASTALVETAARLVSPSNPLIASTVLAQIAARITSTVDTIIATSVLAGTGTITNTNLPTIAVAAVVRSGNIAIVVRDGSAQALCRDGTIAALVR